MWENLECLGIHRHLRWMKCEVWRGAVVREATVGVGLMAEALVYLTRKLEYHFPMNEKSLEKNCMTRFLVFLCTHT